MDYCLAMVVSLNPLLYGYVCLLCRGTWIPQISCSSGVGASMDRRKVESAWETSTLRFGGSKDLRTIWCPSNHESYASTSRRRHCFKLHRQLPTTRTLKSKMGREKSVYILLVQRPGMIRRSRGPCEVLSGTLVIID